MRFLFLLLLAFGICSLGIAWAAEGSGFSGNLNLEAGGIQLPSSEAGIYSYYRLFLAESDDLAPNFSFGLAGEANWQTYTPQTDISWPLYPRANYLKLETDDFSSSQGGDIQSLQLDRAYLQGAVGSLSVTAGLFKPQWGGSYFYKPTDYFFPLPPLQWDREEALASEGLDASCFLFEDLSLEGALRWLQGGDAEGVLKLVEKGIGITFTPSLAWMIGRNGVGLEASGTFPTAQVRFEGVDWVYPGGHTAAN